MSLNDINSLTHTKWNCKYDIVFALKYRRKEFYKEKRKKVEKISREFGIQSIKWTSKITRRRGFQLDWETNRGYENEDGVDCRKQRYRKADFALTVPHFEKYICVILLS